MSWTVQKINTKIDPAHPGPRGSKIKKGGKFHELPTDHDQIWHAYADRPVDGSYLKKIDPPPKGGRSGNFRGVKKSKVREMSWTVQNIYFFNLTHPTPGVGGLGVKKSKVREMSWTAEKSNKKN